METLLLSETTPNMRVCSWCGEAFDIDYEGVGIDDQELCGYCSSEHAYRCAICEELELEERRGDIGTILIVDGESEDLEDGDAGVPDGVYEITQHPYYGGSIIGTDEIFPYAVKRLGDLKYLKNKYETDGYSCAHLCRYCDEKIKKNLEENKEG